VHANLVGFLLGLAAAAVVVALFLGPLGVTAATRVH